MQDWILAANEEELEYVPVEFWLHRVPEQVINHIDLANCTALMSQKLGCLKEAEFNVFETSDGKTIKLTDKHYIFKVILP